MIKSTATGRLFFLLFAYVIGLKTAENLTAAQRKTNNRPTPNQRKTNNENGGFLSPALIDFKTMTKITRISRDNFNHREIIANKAIARYSTK